MNQGQVSAQINDCEKILGRLELLETRNWHPTKLSDPGARFRKSSYTEIWKACFSEKYYDFILNDYSLLHFRIVSLDPIHVSYSYLECPYRVTTYKTFIEQNFPENIAEAGDLFKYEYEIELSSFPPKDSVTPIRYDFDIESYQEGLHPVSHLHIGFNNDLRIGTKNILRPLSFLLFIIRQCYRDKWRNLTEIDESEFWCRNVRTNLDSIDDQFLQGKDHLEMIMT